MTAIGILLIIFAIFIIPILVILAFIAPKLLNIKTDKRPEGKHNRKEFLTGLCGLFIISVIAGAIMMPSEDKAKTAKDTPVTPKPISADPTPVTSPTPQAVASVPSTPKATEQVKTLGITPEEFNKKFEVVAKSYGATDTVLSPLQADKHGEIMLPLSQGLTLSGHIDKNSGKITDINYAVTSAKNNEAIKAMKALSMLSIITVQVLDPERPKSLMDTMIDDTFQEYMKTKKTTHKSAVINNIEYKVDIVTGAGILVSFEAV